MELCSVLQLGSTKFGSTFESTAALNYSSRPKLQLGSVHVKIDVWTRPKVPNEWHTMNWFQDSYFNLNKEGHADLGVWGTRKVGSLHFVPIPSCVDFVSTNFFFTSPKKDGVLVVYFYPKIPVVCLVPRPVSKKHPPVAYQE